MFNFNIFKKFGERANFTDYRHVIYVSSNEQIQLKTDR